MNIAKKGFKTNCVSQIPLFDVLNNEEKDFVHSFVIHKTFKAGETIYSPGEIANSIYIISSGKIRIYRLSENGKEQLVRMLVSGEFTGELALFKEGIYEAFAESLEDTTICMIRHNDFKKILLKYPLISTKMLEVLANRLSTSEEQTTFISTETVRDRLIHYLSRMQDSNNELTLDITKKDLASYLGTTPESLSREFTKLINDKTLSLINKNTYKLHGFNLNIKPCKITY